MIMNGKTDKKTHKTNKNKNEVVDISIVTVIILA